MAYTHRIQFTKNILNGENQGEQRLAFHNCRTATEAARVALELNQGAHRDPWTGEGFTAHNIRIASIERELPELGFDSRDGAGRGWDAFDAADFAHDAGIEASQ
jgi:hypothetical protein